MKRPNYIFVLLAIATTSVILQSCKDEKNVNSTEVIPEKEVAIDILQEKNITQYAEDIFESGNEEFIEGEIIQKIISQNNIMRIKASEDNDTVKSADFIPISKSLAIQEWIYTDGDYYYNSVDNTAPEMKLIESLNVNKQPENEIVVKTEIIKNVVYLYNSSGNVIKQQAIGGTNFKALLDSLKLYLSAKEDSGTQVQKVKASIAIRKAEAKGMRVISQNNDEVIVEMNLGNQTRSFSRKINSNVIRKAIMSFTPDMVRMNYQKIYENNQLISQIKNIFADEVTENFNNSISGYSEDLLPNANLKGTFSKKLSFSQNGTPIVVNNIETYKKNIVKYNLK